MFFYKHLVLFLVLALNFVPANGVSRLSIDEQENIRIYEKSSRAVVNISNIAVNYDFFYRAIPAESGSGTGFIIGESGIIVTNYHVVENASKLVVTLADNSQWPGKMVGADPNNDLAIVRIKAPADSYDILEFSHSNNIVVGQKVLALGNPFGLRQTLTTGIISALGRTIAAKNGRKIEGIIQTDAAINPGNSGGTLLNMKGQVIGINTAILSVTGEFAGVGFAIPSNTVSKIVPALIEDGKYHHPWIGITGQDIDPDLAQALQLKQAKGFMIITVVDGSPADKAGLKGRTMTLETGGKEYPAGGDIIISVDDKEVRKISDILIHLQREKSVGDTMVLGVLRDGEFLHITLELVERPDL